MLGPLFEGNVPVLVSVVSRRVLLVIVLAVVALLAVTAVRVSAASSTPVVYVAVGDNFPDALGAASAAAVQGGPVLLVTKTSIPGETRAELTRLSPDVIYVAGGTAVISDAVFNQLKAYAGSVVRVAGSNRYGTAAAVSQSAFPVTGGGVGGGDVTALTAAVNALTARVDALEDANALAVDADLLDGRDSTDFLGVSDQAADSLLLDGRDSTAFVEHGAVEMTASGNAWMGHESTPATRFGAATSFPGSGAAVISLPGPVAIDGVAYGLESFELCIITFATGYVDQVGVIAINAFDATVDDDQYNITTDTTDRTTGCHTYTVNSQVGQGIGLQVGFAGGGTVELYAVRSVWTTAAG